MSNELTHISLFPIPDLVAFPGTIVPLHVFEPRYRLMVNESITQNRMIGVCHTRKEISAAKKKQSVEDALKSNQATYQPQAIFSAGYAKILETTADGRIYANIDIQSRFKIVTEIQTLPYRIVGCEELIDSEDQNSQFDANLTTEQGNIQMLEQKQQAAITRLVLEIIGGTNPAVTTILNDERWANLPAEKFSYKVFQFLHFDADTMQSILETTSSLGRLQMIHAILTEVTQNRD